MNGFSSGDYLYKVIIYNAFGESDTLLLNIQLNSYDKHGNPVDALLLDSRFSYEDIIRFSDFTIKSDYSISIENYVTYLYEDGKYGEIEGKIKNPVPQIYIKAQYQIDNGYFKLVSQTEEK